MFNAKQAVEVHVMLPGQTEKYWHKGEVLGQYKGRDGKGSAAFEVIVAGGPTMIVLPQDIREIAHAD